MKPATPVPSRAPVRRLFLGATLATALALAGWALLAGPGDAPPAPRPGAVPAPRAPGDATLASPFGAGPAVSAQVEAPNAPAAAVAPARPHAGMTPAAALPPPTLDASERAEARALLANAGALDADSARELDALLYQDALQRFFALREAGDTSDELRALSAELRAGLPAREAARDLPGALLAQAQAALRPGADAASPFARPR
ncbi:hypothetical protein BurJ1DRAFT_0222 [Burkholderiales bacterium JOSHI_001]|nr:hypothetical protein BurJ1DRAFT_0222 [Burkholderiales bacterium JOSHI_001]